MSSIFQERKVFQIENLPADLYNAWNACRFLITGHVGYNETVSLFIVRPAGFNLFLGNDVPISAKNPIARINQFFLDHGARPGEKIYIECGVFPRLDLNHLALIGEERKLP